MYYEHTTNQVQTGEIRKQKLVFVGLNSKENWVFPTNKLQGLKKRKQRGIYTEKDT